MKVKKRKIPATMATQHPDHASRPYWHHEAYIPAIEETRELFLSLSNLGISEYMWDWEGKLVDESVLERLIAKNYDYFKTTHLGKDKFLTFRLPNLKVQTEFRLGRALMGILSAAGLTKQVGMHSPPLFEVILPMTESAHEMINVQEAFSEIASLKHPLNKFEKDLLKHIELIPLFEQVSTISRSEEILEQYFALHKKTFGFFPKSLRPFIARSDPALNSGLVPTVVSAKIALSGFKRFSKKHRVELYPIIGVGSLPFRGGLSATKVRDFITEYKGIRTATLQSAFRYDFPLSTVKTAIQILEDELPKHTAQTLSKQEEANLTKLSKPFESAYQKSIGQLAPLINQIAAHIPKRRERVQHIGLFGYSRGVGKVRLPRAISFTAALYSFGLPPELIGTGRGLAKTLRNGKINLLEKTYINLKLDLEKAGAYLYKPGLIKLAKHNKTFNEILQDVTEIEKYLGHELQPKNIEERQHCILSEKLQQNLKNKKSLTSIIGEQAILRHSIG